MPKALNTTKEHARITSCHLSNPCLGAKADVRTRQTARTRCPSVYANFFPTSKWKQHLSELFILIEKVREDLDIERLIVELLNLHKNLNKILYIYILTKILIPLITVIPCKSSLT